MRGGDYNMYGGITGILKQYNARAKRALKRASKAKNSKHMARAKKAIAMTDAHLSIWEAEEKRVAKL